MNRIFILFALLSLTSALGGQLADISKEVARSMGYPAEYLVIKEVKYEETEFEKTLLLGAWRIEGEIPDSFFPVVIAISKAGSLFDSKVLDLNEKVDALPDEPTPRGKGAFGSFSIGGKSKGGIHLSRHGKVVAVISTLTLPEQGIDIRISIECPFGPENLSPISGGEEYIRRMSADSGFDLKSAFISINKVVLDLDGYAHLDDTLPPTSTKDSDPAILPRSPELHSPFKNNPRPLEIPRRYRGWWFGVAVIGTLAALVAAKIFQRKK